MSESDRFSLEDIYVVMGREGRARTVPGGDAFWADLSGGKTPTDLTDKEARLAAVFRFSKNWTSWERHPAGEELVYVCSGEIDLVLEEAAGERMVRLGEGEGFLVPRNLWHTANVWAPAVVLHVTPGAGSEHRAR